MILYYTGDRPERFCCILINNIEIFVMCELELIGIKTGLNLFFHGAPQFFNTRESSQTLVYNISISAPHWLEEQSTKRGSTPTFLGKYSGT